jgi:4-hydroxybenzoate polyprenyltransferase/phosphoserine phosphatase
MTPAITPLPLVVDLDGTLIKTDLLFEAASQFVLAKPWWAPKLLSFLFSGKSCLKIYLAQNTNIDVTSLPYNDVLISWLKQKKSEGRVIVMATASPRLLADKVAAHLGLFDEVLATDASTNLKALAKRMALVAKYGEKGFDYVGNDWADLPVWRAAFQAHVVSRSSRLIEAARRQGNLGQVFSDGKMPLAKSFFKAMRPHQWVKNLLVFIPLLAAHSYGVFSSLESALVAFVVFGMTASSVYLLNDLVDIADDRKHAHKRLRPFAAGHLSLLLGWLAWPLLLLCAFNLAAATLPWPFTLSLVAYFGLTVVYSFWLKRIPMVDVLTLAGLYTIRIVAGAAAITVPMTFWLLSFSMFMFLSLAFIKRYSELKGVFQNGQAKTLRGRGYNTQDLELVANLGVSAGYTSVLVLALYIQDSHTAGLYATPQFIWLACPLLLFWISRTWLIAHRGQMHEDPVVFALKDRVSWAVAALFAGVFVLAKVAVV